MPPRSRSDDAGETPLVPSVWRWAPIHLGTGSRFVVAFILLLGLQAGALISLNVAVNPRGEFGTHGPQPLVVDDVSARARSLAALDGPPDRLVLGTSRSVSLGSDELAPMGPGTTFNFAVSASHVHDALVIYRSLRGQGVTPDTVVYGVELDQFRPNRTTHSMVERAEALDLDGTGASLVAQAEAWLGSLDEGYVWDSLRSLWYVTTGYPDAQHVYEPDGSRMEAWIKAGLEQGEVDASAHFAERVDRNRQKLENTGPPAPDALAALDTLIAEARADGVTVELFLTPVHPDVLDGLAGTPYPASHAAFEAALIDRCAPGVRVHDLHEIQRFGGDPDGFRDAWHYFGENGRKIGHAIAGGDQDLCQTAQVPADPTLADGAP